MNNNHQVSALGSSQTIAMLSTESLTMPVRNRVKRSHAPFKIAGMLRVLTSVALLSGCSQIWNAGDLAVWVKDRAEGQGCVRETIVLEDWYTSTAEGNVWRGTCRDAKDNPKSFGINVDSVWTPSEKPR